MASKRATLDRITIGAAFHEAALAAAGRDAEGVAAEIVAAMRRRDMLGSAGSA